MQKIAMSHTFIDFHEPITTIIIAHNESEHIEECLDSLIHQSCIPNEIIVIVHNSDDRTAKIAQAYRDQYQGKVNIRVDEHKTEASGPIYARIRGISIASHEIITCIDGDSIADPEWVEHVVRPFSDPSIAGVGGMIWFIGEFMGNIAAFHFFILSRLNPFFHFYFWGANFACRKSAYLKCGWLEPFVQIRHGLGLHYWAEDCYLSLALETQGKVIFCPHAKVRVYPSQIPNSLSRGVKQESDRKKIFGYFKL